MRVLEEKIAILTHMPITAETFRVFRCVPHRHSDVLEFIYCLEGKLHILVGHQRVTLSAGEFQSMDMDDPHCLWTDEACTAFSLHIDMKAVRQEWEKTKPLFFACESHSVHPYNKEVFEIIRFLLLTAARTSLSEEGVFQENSHFIANAIVDLLITHFNWFNLHETYLEKSKELKERFHQIIDYCQKNYNQKISIKSIANLVHINRNYLSHYLQRSAFHSFSNMLNYIRCYESEKLLLDTNMPIHEISYACGFSDPKYYYKYFGLWWGSTPLQHRKWYETYRCMETKKEIIPMQKAVALIEKEIVRACIANTLKVAPSIKTK